MLDLESIRGLEIFQNLSTEDLGKVFGASRQMEFAPGAVIVREGSPGGMLQVIFEGLVEVRKAVGTEEKPLASLGPGMVFGEMSLFDGFPYSASIVAREETRTLCIFRNDFMALAEAEPKLAYKITVNLLNLLSLKLRKTNENLVTLALLRESRG